MDGYNKARPNEQDIFNAKLFAENFDGNCIRWLMPIRIRLKVILMAYRYAVKGLI